MNHSNDTVSGPKIFLSYSTKDTGLANELRSLLEKEGIHVWQDITDLHAGDIIQPHSAIIRAMYFLVLLTRNSLDSLWVQQEVRLARSEGVCIIPLIADETLGWHELPRYFLKRRCVDMRRDEDLNLLISQLQKGCQTTRAPMMAESNRDVFVERPAEIAALKLELLKEVEESAPVAITTAMVGTGGFGKTMLAQAICQDPEIQERFDDGILWVTLGEKPDEQSLLSKMGSLIYALSRESCPPDMQIAHARLGELLNGRDILLVIDDVWRPEDLKHFLEVGGKTVRWLITTRNHEVLPGNAHNIQVDIMQEPEAVELLAANLPGAMKEEAALKRLAKLLGYWPLLLSLVNGRLRESVLRMKRSLIKVIQWEEELLHRDGVAGFNMRNSRDRNKLASVSLDLSITLLDEMERGFFLDLAIFPEDTEIPVPLIHRLWQARQGMESIDVLVLLGKLSNFSLLQHFDGHTGIKLHDIIHTHLRSLHNTHLEKVQGVFLDSYHEAPTGGWALEITFAGDYLPEGRPQELQYIWRNVKYHLQEAGRIQEWWKMLSQVEFMAKRTWVLGSTAETINDLDSCSQTQSDDIIPLTLAWHYRHASPWLMECDTWQEMGRILIQRLWGTRLTLEQIKHVVDLDRFMPILLPVTTPPGHPSRDFFEKQKTEGHAGWILSCLHLGGDRYVSTSSDKSIKLWSWREGSDPVVVETFKGHGGQVTACASLPNNRLVTASEDARLLVWNLKNGEILKTLSSHTKRVNDCAVLPDGRVVSVSEDGQAFLWSPDGDGPILSCPLVLEKGPHSVTACAVSADGGKLLTAYENGTLKMRELATNLLLATLEGGHQEAVTDCAILEDGRVVSVSKDGSLVFWGKKNYKQMKRVKAHNGAINSLAVVNGMIVTAHDDKECDVWDQTTGKKLRTLSGHRGEVFCAQGMEGGRVLTGSEDKNLLLWDLAKGTIITTFQRKDGIQDCAFLDDGRVIAASETGNMEVWSEHGNKLFDLPMHKDWIWSALALPGKRVASCSADGTCKIWHLGETLEQSRELHTLKGHEDAVWSSCFLPDDKQPRMLSCSEDGTLRFWDINTGKEKDCIQAHEEGICDCTVSNGRPVTACYDGTLKIWEMDKKKGSPTGKPFATLTDHTDQVWCCKALPDGRFISGSNDKTLILWSPEGKKLWQHQGHNGCICGCAASKDALTPLFATSSEDCSFKVWDFDPETNLPRLLATYYAEGAFNFCDIHPDNRHFAVAGGHGLYFLRLIYAADEVIQTVMR